MKRLRTGLFDIVPGLLLLVALGAAGCDVLDPDDPGGPGTLTVTLVSPHGSEGSAVFELSGAPGLGTVSPFQGEVLYDHGVSSSRIVVILDDPGEIRFQVRTEDVGTAPAVRVIQVADGTDQLRSSVSGYEVSISREKDPSRKGSGG